jgi:hypothetical protein
MEQVTILARPVRLTGSLIVLVWYQIKLTSDTFIPNVVDTIFYWICRVRTVTVLDGKGETIFA